uniref:Nucleosome assembly protein 1-like 1 n=1 Tax=Syphacia muris TaxID=451379 RepID=A0A0N5AFK3_9BILA
MATETKNLGDLLKTNGYETDAGFELLTSLPKSVKRRIKALKKLQIEGIKLEAEFYEKVHELEIMFAPKFEKLHLDRKGIVTGEHEPTDEEADCPILHNLTEEELKKVEDTSAPEPNEVTKGIPDFWLNTLKSVDRTAEMIQEHDEPILKHLVDISLKISRDPDSFTLTFHFTPNEYFKETELTKWYKLQLAPDSDDPFDYDGPLVVEAKGSEITWNEGKDVTKKVLKKKQKKGPGAGKFITKTVKADSFFNFFDTIVLKETDKDKDGDDEEFDEERSLLNEDFEIGQMFRDQIIPRAVLFYTGEAITDDDYIDDFEGDDDEEVCNIELE